MAEAKPDTKKAVDVVSQTATELLEQLGVKVGVSAQAEEEGVVAVNIDAGEETGLLIGRRGDNIEAIQTALGLIVRQKLGEWKRVVVNIGDWREKQEDYLRNLALDTAARVRQTGKPEPLYNLSAAQRRIVHMSLAEEPGIKTESTGEGRERYLIVSPA